MTAIEKDMKHDHMKCPLRKCVIVLLKLYRTSLDLDIFCNIGIYSSIYGNSIAND